MDLQNSFYRYKKIFKKEKEIDDSDRFEEMLEELVTLEKFSVMLDEPQEAVVVPAWLKKYNVKSNDKTSGEKRLKLNVFLFIKVG